MTCPAHAFFKVEKAELGGRTVIAELVHHSSGSMCLERVAQGELTLKGGFCSQSLISDLPNPGIKLTSLTSPTLGG